jgi:hypothetical protein
MDNSILAGMPATAIRAVPAIPRERRRPRLSHAALSHQRIQDDLLRLRAIARLRAGLRSVMTITGTEVIFG